MLISNVVMIRSWSSLLKKLVILAQILMRTEGVINTTALSHYWWWMMVWWHSINDKRVRDWQLRKHLYTMIPRCWAVATCTHAPHTFHSYQINIFKNLKMLMSRWGNMSDVRMVKISKSWARESWEWSQLDENLLIHVLMDVINLTHH